MSNKLILLNGPAGVGKSTIAQLYAREHPLTLSIEGDQVIGMIGSWRAHELEARKLKFLLITTMIRTHLAAGHDVILPYLVTDATHADAFEQIAKEHGADFHEVLLVVEKSEAVQRLLERGRWGEEGSKQLTEEDVPKIERLYDMMTDAATARPNVVRVPVMRGDVPMTYRAFLEAIV